GAVTVTGGAGSSIATSGAGAFGVLAQSVGGGGGDGGSRASTSFTAYLSITIGGSGGVGGDGGAVKVTNSDTAICAGAGDDVGSFAQSVGGGGGTGGNGLAAAVGTVHVGGTGGASGNGGAVTVTHSGSIATGVSTADANTAAHGIVAQSIGGG